MLVYGSINARRVAQQDNNHIQMNYPNLRDSCSMELLQMVVLIGHIDLHLHTHKAMQ